MKVKDVGAIYGRYWQKALAPPLATATLVASLALPEYVYALGNNNQTNVNCDVVIIGGGPGGVHTAWRLATIPNNAGTVCLIEKENRLGGRVEDVELGKNGEVIPLGAMRVPQYHYTFGLMNELGLEMNPQLKHNTLIGILNPNLLGFFIFYDFANNFSKYLPMLSTSMFT